MLRCFHRTFVCTGPTADAQSKNWPVSILHDCLYIGAGKVNTAATSTPAATTTPSQPAGQMQALGAASSAPAAAAASSLPPLTAQDQQMVAALCQHTGIDAATATQLLVQCQGDMNKAAEQVAIMRSQGR